MRSVLNLLHKTVAGLINDEEVPDRNRTWVSRSSNVFEPQLRDCAGPRGQKPAARCPRLDSAIYAMTKIIIDNQEIECRDGINVLQAALEPGWDIPHYCYHPGLSVVASCRLCLMEMQMPHPKTREMVWSPKLVPSCQTPVREGMVVRFNSQKVKKNQEI